MYTEPRPCSINKASSLHNIYDIEKSSSTGFPVYIPNRRNYNDVLILAHVLSSSNLRQCFRLKFSFRIGLESGLESGLEYGLESGL
jgi:hypothetical protein